MVVPLAFRDALPADATELSELAFGSKAHWGYPVEFMQACRQELTVAPESIASGDIHYVVAVIHQEIYGFYALADLSGTRIELGALFVEAKHIGSGIGRQLMARAMTLGAHTMNIQSDPHALKFYRSAGARVIGKLESGSVPGRFLPLLEICLVSDVGTKQDRLIHDSGQ